MPVSATPLRWPQTDSAISGRWSLGLGAAATALVIVLNVVNNPVDLRHHQVAGSVFAHGAVLLLAWGLASYARQVLDGLLASPPAARARRMTVWIVATAAAMAGAAAAAPDRVRSLLTREWGVVEPVQVVLYLAIAWLCWNRCRRLATADPLRRLYLAGAGACLVMVLEEVDYFGLVNALLRGLGFPHGRVTGRHLGAIHDVGRLLESTTLIAVAAAVALGAVAGVAWWLWRGRTSVLAREIVSLTSLPLVGTLVFMALAQAADLGPDFVDPTTRTGRVVAMLREEPVELLAVLCLMMTVVLKYPRPPGRP